MKLKLPTLRLSSLKFILLCSFFLFNLVQKKLYAQTREYANQVTFENHVDNAINSTLPNNSFSTLNSYGGIAIGIGSYSGELELQFPSTVPANTTTFIQVDFDTDILNSLLGGSLGNLLADVLGNVVFGDHYFDVEARYFDGNTSNPVFSSTSSVIPSDNRYRIVKDSEGNFYIAITPDQDYNRIYIEDNTDALLVGFTNNMNVYHASYFTDNECAIDPLFTDYDGQGLTVDLLELGGAGVTNPEYVIDENPDNYSEMSLGLISVLASIRQNVYFPSSYQPNEEFSVTLKTEPTLVTLGLLNNVEVIAYNDGSEVYSENLPSVLNLDLLTLLQNGEKAKIIFSPGVSFDRVSVRLSSLLNVNLAQSIDIYEIAVVGPDAPTTDETDQEFCLINNPTVANIEVNEPIVVWYNQPTGGIAYDPTDALIDGASYYGAQIVDGCESEDRLEVTVSIGDAPTPTTNQTLQEFCLVNNPTVADIQVNEPDVTWYNQSTGGIAYDPTDALIDGNIYYASLTDATTGCESAIRLEVTVSIGDAPTPTTNQTLQEFCLVNNPTVADIQVNEPDVTWYNQSTGGIAYDPTDALIDGTSYYASLTDATTGCESAIRLEVTVSIGDAPTPTTNQTQQEFCLVNNPTVADIQVNEPDVTWYNQPTGGIAYDPTDALIDGTSYYASLTDATTGCESAIRLEVTVSIGDAPTPTTNQTQQEFCLFNNPTVADIQVNEPDVTWYNQSTGGIAYDPTDALIDGTSYYASLTNTTTGCESAIRLEVTVSIGDAPTPTTNQTQQEFCLFNNPTVADIQVNEPDVTWYNQSTGGIAYDPTDALIDGTSYYASLTDATTGCESAIRLEVTVSIGDAPTPTTNQTQQEFCLVNNPTVADIQVNEPDVTWYNQSTGGIAYDPTDALIDGTSYYASLTDATTGCESAIRLEVTVSIGDAPTPTTNQTQQEFCLVNNPTVADIQVNEPDVTWYNQSTGGIAYDPTDALIDGTSYYASLTDATTGCESAIRLEVTVSIGDAPTPTTNQTLQEFCLVNNPTVADIQVNEPDVTWYNQPTGGIAYDPTDALIDGTSYYASLTDATTGCESAIRLEVTVSIGDAPTPTTNQTLQEFCLVNNPTVADIQVNEPDVTWYNQPTSGIAYDPTDALIDGTSYYASLTDATTGCESAIRLEVTVSIGDAPTPTTNQTLQEFCLVNNPTVADIQVNEPDVTWYNQPTGGVAYDPTDALIDGTSYYASLTDATTGCESAIRLEVIVSVGDGHDPVITSSTQESVCLESLITYTTESGNQNYIWTISGGTVMDGGNINDNTVSVLWDSIENTTVSVSYDSSNPCATGNTTTFEEIVMVCADITIDKTVDNLNPMIEEVVTFSITVKNEGPNDFTEIQISEEMPSGFELIDFTTTLGTYNPITSIWEIDLLPAETSATLEIRAEVLGQGDYTNIAGVISSIPTDSDVLNNSSEVRITPLCLIVYNEFSPNEDGVNDNFVISCIENYPNNTLQIFNRYGSLLYKKNSYLNTWDGKANVSGVTNNQESLPAGTYFYILEIENMKSKSGWIYLAK